MIVQSSTSRIIKYLELVLLVAVLFYFGKTLLVPLCFGLLIAMVMCPVCRWLEKKGCSRSVAVAICLWIVTILVVALVLLLVWQLKLFSKDAPMIFEKASLLIQSVQQQLATRFGIPVGDMNLGAKLTAGAGGMLSGVFNAASSTLFMLFLIPVYTALFLYHRGLFVQFIQAVLPAKYKSLAYPVTNTAVHTYFNYIKGMVLVYIIVGALNSVGLLILGVRHAFLFGMLCAIMTIIPYLGIIISALLPISVVWMDTGNVLYPLGVVVVFVVVQYLEANIIFPKVVGTQLDLSTFAVLVAIIAGGIIWGVSGMVLFIPFAAIAKIVSDNIEELKPLNILLSRK